MLAENQSVIIYLNLCRHCETIVLTYHFYKTAVIKFYNI